MKEKGLRSGDIMYNFSKNIRIRVCDELSFLVNISNNNLFVVKTKTLEFLKLELEKGLTVENQSKFNPSFIAFIRELEDEKILEDSLNEF